MGWAKGSVMILSNVIDYFLVFVHIIMYDLTIETTEII